MHDSTIFTDQLYGHLKKVWNKSTSTLTHEDQEFLKKIYQPGINAAPVNLDTISTIMNDITSKPMDTLGHQKKDKTYAYK
jgi:hypothetical protein